MITTLTLFIKGAKEPDTVDTGGTGPCNTSIRARAWFFTWNNPGNTANTVLEMLGASKWCWQLECGTDGTEHIQGVLYFKNARKFSQLKKACPKVHWEKAKSLKACVKYCSKVKTRIGETHINGFEIPELITTICLADMDSWQSDILKLLEEVPDKRTVHWFWEEVGGIGKTEFCKYLVVNHKDCVYVNGKNTDMKFAIVKFVEKHKRGPKILLCDFPRDYRNFVSYVGIEELKNGIFFSGKYESCMCLYNTPHILCFANFPPEKFKLSKDRWNIKNITIDET